MTNQQEARFRPYAGVLAECRDMVRERLVAALSEARQAIEAELFNRRLASADNAEGQLLAEAQHQLRRVGAELDRGFRTAFDKAFQERTAATPNAPYGGENLGFPELSLVDDEQFSEELTVQNLARQLRSATDAELQELQPRVAFMLGETEIEAARDPLAPDTICEALSEACTQLDSPRPVKALLLEMFARRLGAALAPVYHDVNQHLVARQVLPRVRHTVARTPGRAPGAAGAAQPGRGGPAQGELGSILQQLFGTRDAVGGGAAGHAPHAVIGEGTDTEVLDLLTRLQRGEAAGALGGETFAVTADPSGTTNVLHGLVDAGLSKHLNQVDGIVIDVVATMFDYIFEDERVPGAMKGLIGRLQIPVLKLAMKDHTFFSNRQHPARRLINALAQAASTWDDDFSAESPLFRIADFLVHRVQDEFNDDGAIFAVCLQEFEDFLADQDRRVDKRAATVTSQLEQRERMEIASSVAQNTVAAHVANPALPAAVREFIGELWSKVLRRAAVVGGESGDQWRQAAGVMDELVWSVLPKRGREERQRLVQTLPRLLAGLREGLEAIEVAQVLRDAFFTELVKLHAAAVKAGMTESAAAREVPTPPAVQAPPAAQPPAAEAEATDAAAPELDALKRGSSIELKDESGAVRRVRLTWISPARTMYLFANRQGQRALALTRVELARRFAAGDASLADDEPLLDRIVGNVLDSYQPEVRHL